MRKASYLLALLAVITVSFLAGRHFTHDSSPGTGERRVLYYVDPMHPAYKSEKPGIAPDCGMQLEPVYADASGAAILPASMAAGTVSISPEQQQLIGVRVAAIENSTGKRNLRVLGRVAADETRIYRANAVLDGFIQATYKDATGSFVKKDQRLATYFSADSVTAQQAYLGLLQYQGASDTSPLSRVGITTQSAQFGMDRLRSLGMSDGQIASVTASRKPAHDIEIVAPIDGFIIGRSVSPGLRFEKGLEFYRFADLSRVWIVADIYENEAQYFRPGVVARVTLSNQGKTFSARVSDVLPQFDPGTRTLKLRLEAENPGFVLRPDMFVDIELPITALPGMSIPSDAVLDSGLMKRVFVEVGPGLFEPRTVETGWRSGDRVEIVRGLSPGERIVVSGTFLVDSESRLKAPVGNATVTEVSMAEAKHDQAEAKHDHSTPALHLKHVKTSEMNSASMAASGMSMTAAAKDPTCGMDVDPAKASAADRSVEYHGKTYYFCSAGCKDKFQKEPEHYLATSHQGTGQ